MAKILVLNGPNLNLLGEREPHIYGTTSLADINALLAEQAAAQGHELNSRQSNSEGDLVNYIQQAKKDGIQSMIINAASLSHTSLPLRDALVAVELPFVEVHLSNIYKREAFRHKSIIADLAIGIICGFGVQSYELALSVVIRRIDNA